MMIIVLFWLFVSRASSYEFNTRCSNESDNLSFKRAEDGVDGRYKVDWCTNLEHYDYTWELTLFYIDNYPAEKCQNHTIKTPVGLTHSYVLNKITSRCTNTICLTTYLDLIFNGTCYRVVNNLVSSEQMRYAADRNDLIFVDHEFPKLTFTNSSTTAHHATLDDKKEQIVWVTGYIPVEDFTMHLAPNDTHGKYEEVSKNCTIDTLTRNKIICLLDKPRGCYKMHLTHASAWITAAIFNAQIHHDFDFCSGDGKNDLLKGGDDGMSPATMAVLYAGVAVVGSMIAVLLLVSCRSKRGENLRKQVLRHWKSSGAVVPRKAVPVGTRVLLIYARDCPPFARAVQALAAALRRTGCQVIDIFSTEAAVQSARAPNEWLRRLATDPATRLLLLQSPAGLTLTPQLTQHGSPTLSAPLLGRAAVRRAPHAADNMAMMALRLLGEAAIQPLAYRKCYVATIKGLDCEMVPGVTPLRRYVLPAYADVLLRDLTPGADNDLSTDDSLAPTAGPDTADLLQDLTDALTEMCDYVRDNPNYLTDELLFI